MLKDAKKVFITPDQRSRLENIWFVYGHNGPGSSLNNHKFIQCILENGEDARDFYFPTMECLEAVEAILNEAA